MTPMERDVAKQNGDDAKRSRIIELAEQIHQLHKQAKHEYQPIVDSIIGAGRRDVREIERTLDELLDFAGSDSCLPLFRRLCRYYWDFDPAAAAEYVLAYREMWDSEE